MIRLVAAFLLLCSVAAAEPPALKVTHTELKVPGDILRVTASAEGVKSTTWEAWADIAKEGPTQEQIDSLTKQVEAAGGTAIFSEATERKTYYLTCDGGMAIDLPTWEGQKWIVFVCVSNATGEQAKELLEIQCPGRKPPPVPPVPPTPPVPPKPDPPTPPPVPVPTATLSKIANDGVKAAVNDTNRLEFILLAGVYMSGADDAKTGKFPTVEALLANVKALTYKCMPTSVAAWKPTGGLIEIELDRLRDAGTLDTTKPASYEQPFRDIGAGILTAVGVSSATALELLEGQQ